MNPEEKVKNYIKENNIEAEHIVYESSVHSVQDLINVSGIDLELITKSMIFKDDQDRTIAAVVPAKYRVSGTRVRKALGLLGVEILDPEETFKRTGYKVGGMLCFGFESILIIDPKVLEHEYVYLGGGSTHSVTKIATKELEKLNPIVKAITGTRSN
jgi:prolyl-tRNA editing enzyme YbaK/EbsC (Cys-tRNA(Pro) deacylase)